MRILDHALPLRRHARLEVREPIQNDLYLGHCGYSAVELPSLNCCHKPAASCNVVRARPQAASHTEWPRQRYGISEGESRLCGDAYRLELTGAGIEKQLFPTRIPRRVIRSLGAIAGKFMANSRCRKRLNKNRRLTSLRLRIATQFPSGENVAFVGIVEWTFPNPAIAFVRMESVQSEVSSPLVTENSRNSPSGDHDSGS